MAEQPEEYDIERNIMIVRENIAKYAALANRDIKEITLVGVTKFFTAQDAEYAFKAGLRDFGENRVKELIEKRGILAAKDICPNWHLIGTLQRNKVRQIIGKSYLIHSVDSLGLLGDISKQSTESGIISQVLLQFNISGEETKHGFCSGETDMILEYADQLKNIDIQGIMTMAPLTEDEKILHEVFSGSERLFHDMKDKYKKPSFRIISMGMSNDYHIAIQHGATHLRIGTAIFGHRC